MAVNKDAFVPLDARLGKANGISRKMQFITKITMFCTNCFPCHREPVL